MRENERERERVNMSEVGERESRECESDSPRDPLDSPTDYYTRTSSFGTLASRRRDLLTMSCGKVFISW
jgi:hypothetical protein